MNIVMDIKGNPRAWLELLEALVRINEGILQDEPDFPALYGSGVRYQREIEERFVDVAGVLRDGIEDCDSLSAWRCAEFRVRGWLALLPSHPGYREAKRMRLRSIRSQVFLRRPKNDNLYHALVVYRVGTEIYEDDPSARLGMLGTIDPEVRRLERRKAA